MKEKTKTWLGIAESDLEFAKSILKNKSRVYYAVQFCHQAIEKILKAIIQEHTEETPKKTHNFKMLCQQGHLKLPQNIEAFLEKLAPHYLSSRYPEDMKRLDQIYPEERVRSLLKETEGAFQWFKQFLTSPK